MRGAFRSSRASGARAGCSPTPARCSRSFRKRGIKSVSVICPGFAADCLETLEEIGMENRDVFLAAGGEQYHYIAALNARAGSRRRAAARW